MHALVASAPDNLRQRLRGLPLGELLRTCSALRGSPRQCAEEFATVTAMRSTARQALACERKAAELGDQIEALVRQFAPTLLNVLGVGPIVGAQVVVSWSP